MCCLLQTALGAGANAAPIDLPGAVQPGHDRALPQPQIVPDVDFSVEAPHRSPVPRAVDEIRFKVADIRVEGAVSLNADSFKPLYQNLVGKEVSLGDIFDVADAIEKEYRAAGYLLVRAYVPPQHVNDGIFTIRIVEGFVEGTSVEGGDDRTRDLIKGLSHSADPREAAAWRDHSSARCCLPIRWPGVSANRRVEPVTQRTGRGPIWWSPLPSQPPRARSRR